MEKRNSYKKAIAGPGGLNCSCCRCGSKVYAKRLNARGKRRIAKIALRCEVI